VSPLAGPLVGVPAGALAAGALAVILGLAFVRTARLAVNLDRLTPVTLARACAVGLVYDAARAVALVTRAPHHRR
jgi:hypothetical protein